MSSEVLARENWAYSLEKRDAKYVLSVLCGGVGLYEIDVELAPELAQKCLSDKRVLDRLVEKIRYAPTAFKPNQLVSDV